MRARPVRRGEWRRLGELQPGSLLGATHRLRATTAVGAVVFDPVNPAVVYCGTGEGNWWSWLGVGILRSLDGGASWSTRCTSPFVGQGFYDLRVESGGDESPLRRDTSGLYVSTDHGLTWILRRAVRTWAIAGAPHEVSLPPATISVPADAGATGPRCVLEAASLVRGACDRPSADGTAHIQVRPWSVETYRPEVVAAKRRFVAAGSTRRS